MRALLFWSLSLTLCSFFAPSFAEAASCKNNTRFRIGRGIYDITGPSADTQMMGYANADQVSKGIHMRLRARAFVIESPCNRKRFAFVSADMAHMYHSVRQGVVAKLRKKYGSRYSYDNVLISATHTHQAIAGYSHYALFNATGFDNPFNQGFDKQNYNALVDGIYNAIAHANDNMREGRIKINGGDLLKASMNRSLPAYNNNPDKKKYKYDTDKRMTLLRFEDKRGRTLGLLNWFAVHATNYSMKHRHINGDSKGLASYWFEKKMRSNYSSKDTFVAAFAQSNCGDVSPNLWGVPNGKDDAKHAEIIAKRQYNKAQQLFNSARTPLKGRVEYRHVFLDFAKIRVNGRFTGKGNQKTCMAALGISFAAGSTEDGPSGAKILNVKPKEGMIYKGKRRVKIFPASKSLIRCHAEKDIFFPVGKKKILGNKYPWTPHILPIQLFVVGQLTIASVPFELTTMAGRHAREEIIKILKSQGISEVVIAGLSNAYAGYVATRQEYAKQHYEGASTYYGPWTSAALRQTLAALANAIKRNKRAPRSARVPDMSGKQKGFVRKVVMDAPPIGKKYGKVEKQPKSSYRRGQTVSVTFYGAHPRNNLMTQGTYLKVERKEGKKWRLVAVDGDPETRFSWSRYGIAASRVKIKWTIPRNTKKGTYRICYFGHYKKIKGIKIKINFKKGIKAGTKHKIKSLSGTSRSFKVK